MRPSNTAALARQASGESGSAVPGTRSIEPVIGSNTPFLCASVTGTRSGSTGGSGSIAYSLMVPLLSTMWMASDFFEVVVEGPLGRAGAGATRKAFQEPCGAADGGRRKLVVGDLDTPGAPADGNARKRRLILRFE